MKNLLILIAFIILTPACAQPSNTKSEDWLNKNYKELKNLEWELDAHNNYEAQFEHDGKEYRVDFDESGNWIETERDVKWKELPEAIQSTLKSDNSFDKDEIAEIEWVNSAKDGEYYEVEMKAKGKNTDLTFRTDGTQIMVSGN